MKSYRLLQIFLSTKDTSHPGIFEVSIGLGDDLRCNCPGFVGRETCRHISYVKTKMESNNGVYPLAISSKASAYDTEISKSSNRTMRDFIIKFGKIEVF